MMIAWSRRQVQKRGQARGPSPSFSKPGCEGDKGEDGSVLGGATTKSGQTYALKLDCSRREGDRG